MTLFVAWLVAYATGPLAIASLLRYSGTPLYTAIPLVLLVALGNMLFLYFGVGMAVKWAIEKARRLVVSRLPRRTGSSASFSRLRQFFGKLKVRGYSALDRTAHLLAALHLTVIWLILAFPLFPYSGGTATVALRLKKLAARKKGVMLVTSSVIRNILGTWAMYSAPTWVLLPWEVLHI